MAVAPLNLPGYAQSRDLDFSSLANLGQVYKQAAADTARRETLAQLGNGDKIDPRVLLSSGDMSLANLGVQIQNRQEDQARQAQQDARQLERDKVADANSAAYLRIAQANLARSNDKTPTGFQSDGQGGYEPIAGGPADPAYLRAKGEAENSVAKPRQLSIGDITKLAEEGGKFANVSGFSDTFKPEYAGRTILGDAANIAGRNLPEAVVGKTIADGASWWQGYDRYKNVVRNELFGSALTAPEKAAFEQADINPRMDPAQIQKNLATQKRIAENGLRRKADAMIQSGYNPDVVSKAYGVDLGPIDAGMAKLGMGGPGEIRRQMDSGAEALLRMLTGAGMNMEEAKEYTRRYRFDPTDKSTTVLSKLNQLERELNSVGETVGKGRGGWTPPGASQAPSGNVTSSGVKWSVQ